jgi:hypothetical protein
VHRRQLCRLARCSDWAKSIPSSVECERSPIDVRTLVARLNLSNNKAKRRKSVRTKFKRKEGEEKSRLTHGGQSSDVGPHHVQERGSNQRVLDNERIQVRGGVVQNGAHDVFFTARIRLVNHHLRHEMSVIRVTRRRVGPSFVLNAQRQNQLFQERM